MKRSISATEKLGLLCMAFSLALVCALVRPLPAEAERLSVDAIEKNDPEKSFGEVLLETIAEGDFKRRVVGWMDRAT